MKQVWLSLALGIAWLGMGALEASAQPGGFGFGKWDARSGAYDRNRREPMSEPAPKEEGKSFGNKAPPARAAPRGEAQPGPWGKGRGFGPDFGPGKKKGPPEEPKKEEQGFKFKFDGGKGGGPGGPPWMNFRGGGKDGPSFEGKKKTVDKAPAFAPNADKGKPKGKSGQFFEGNKGKGKDKGGPAFGPGKGKGGEKGKASKGKAKGGPAFGPGKGKGGAFQKGKGKGQAFGFAKGKGFAFGKGAKGFARGGGACGKGKASFTRGFGRGPVAFGKGKKGASFGQRGGGRKGGFTFGKGKKGASFGKKGGAGFGKKGGAFGKKGFSSFGRGKATMRRGHHAFSYGARHVQHRPTWTSSRAGRYNSYRGAGHFAPRQGFARSYGHTAYGPHMGYGHFTAYAPSSHHGSWAGCR